MDDTDGAPPRPDAPIGHEHLEKNTRAGTLATGTLACSRCDAPVALAGRRVAPADSLSCPFCLHTGRVRDFLTLGEPTRPAHVVVRIG